MISFETFKKMVVVEMEQRVGEGKVFLESITKNNDTKIMFTNNFVHFFIKNKCLFLTE